MHEWTSALTYEQADQQLKQQLLTIRELNAATLPDATSRVTKILDAKYEKANLQAVVQSCTNLTPKQQRGLYTLLKKYEPLFDGTLGDWKNSDVSINLNQMQNPIMADPTAYLMYMRQRSVRKSNDFASWEYSRKKTILNGQLVPLLSQKRMEQYVSSPTFAS